MQYWGRQKGETDHPEAQDTFIYEEDGRTEAQTARHVQLIHLPPSPGRLSSQFPRRREWNRSKVSKQSGGWEVREVKRGRWQIDV